MRFFYLVVLISLLASCNNNPAVPDAAPVALQPIVRFERGFFAVDTGNLKSGFDQLYQEHPQFFPFFTNRILRIPVRLENGSIEPAVAAAYSEIIASYRPINDSIQQKYRDMKGLQQELEKAFGFVRHYYPSYPIPKPVTFIGTFDAPGITITNEFLGIGLHQFAGKNFSVYQDPQLLEVYPAYISRRFDEEYIPSSAMKAVADDIYKDSSAGRPLIEQMIEKGKQWYLVKHFLPAANDTLITGYTAKQMNWVKENEGNIWGFINNNADIYTIDPMIVQDYIGEAPFTRGMPEGHAPGNIGQWVGLRIVERFAEKNPELSLQQVLNTPATNIFQGSRYRPK